MSGLMIRVGIFFVWALCVCALVQCVINSSCMCGLTVRAGWLHCVYVGVYEAGHSALNCPLWSYMRRN